MTEGKIIKVVIDDISTINSSMPSKRVLLKRALKGERLIPLKDGSEHLMDENELIELSKLLPSWMKWVLKVPLVLVYNPQNNLIKVLGSEWDEKAIRIILDLKRDEPIRMYHVERLIMKFSSLIFILFEVNIGSLVGGDRLA